MRICWLGTCGAQYQHVLERKIKRYLTECFIKQLYLIYEQPKTITVCTVSNHETCDTHDQHAVTGDKSKVLIPNKKKNMLGWEYLIKSYHLICGQLRSITI